MGKTKMKPRSFGIDLKQKPLLCFYRLIKAISPEYFVDFFLKIYIMVVENFQIYGTQITGKCICQ